MDKLRRYSDNKSPTGRNWGKFEVFESESALNMRSGGESVMNIEDRRLFVPYSVYFTGKTEYTESLSEFDVIVSIELLRKSANCYCQTMCVCRKFDVITVKEYMRDNLLILSSARKCSRMVENTNI